MTFEPARIAVLISGNGSNLQALIDATKEPRYPAMISGVISDNPGAYGLERARKAGINTYALDRKGFDTAADFENAISHALGEIKPDLICLAGFMRILSPDFIARWPEKILNIHPSLLPRHGGPGMYGERVHRAVLTAGDKVSGASVHVVTAGVDEGPVLEQARVSVAEHDTPETLAARVQKAEHALYPNALRSYIEKVVHKG